MALTVFLQQARRGGKVKKSDPVTVNRVNRLRNTSNMGSNRVILTRRSVLFLCVEVTWELGRVVGMKDCHDHLIQLIPSTTRFES
jgi:hypothetical protein